MGNALQTMEQQGSISKTTTQDEKTFEAFRIATNSKAPSLLNAPENKNKKSTRNKTSKSNSVSNPLNKSNTGLSIYRS